MATERMWAGALVGGSFTDVRDENRSQLLYDTAAVTASRRRRVSYFVP